MQAAPVLVPSELDVGAGPASVQADGFEEDEGRYWSVLAVGPATALDKGEDGPPEHARPRRHTFRLRPRMFSGHRLDHTVDPI